MPAASAEARQAQTVRGEQELVDPAQGGAVEHVDNVRAIQQKSESKTAEFSSISKPRLSNVPSSSSLKSHMCCLRLRLCCGVVAKSHVDKSQLQLPFFPRIKMEKTKNESFLVW